MNVLHIASEYPPIKVYGLGRYVHGLARAQAALGSRVHVLTNSCGGDDDGARRDGVHIHRIAFPNPPQPPTGHTEVLQFNHGATARFLDVQDELGPIDVVVCHDWLTILAAREIAAELGAPLVATFHDEVVGKRFGALRSEELFVRDLEALAAHDATRIVANSRFIAEQLAEHYGAPRERLAVVYGGVDASQPDSLPLLSEFRASLVEPEDVLGLYVGRLDEEKGVDVLLEAIDLLGEGAERLKVFIAGDGAQRARLEEQVERSARTPNRVRFVGYLCGAALAYLYQVADIAIVPSIYEPFGLVALEAMAAGCAVVVSAVGGLAEIVRDRKDGLLVAPGDAAALAAAVEELARDADLRARLAQSGLSRAETEFTWSACAKRTSQIYEQAVRSARPVSCRAPLPAIRPRVTALASLDEAGADDCERLLVSLVERTSYPAVELVLVHQHRTLQEVERLTACADALQRRTTSWSIRLVAASPAPSGSEHAALADLALRARGQFVCVLRDVVEIPNGSERWLDGLVWLLQGLGADVACPTEDASPVRAARPGRGAIPERAPRRLETVGGSFLVRSNVLREGWDLHSLLRGEATGRAVWQHPVYLAVRGPVRRSSAEVAGASGPGSRVAASIVVVAHDAPRFTERAIECLIAHTACPYELVLVDNGSQPEIGRLFERTRARLAGRARVEALRFNENRGYPAAANAGIRRARGESIVLLNNDAEVRAGWVDALLAAARSDDRVGIVTAKILNTDGTVQSAGGILHRPDGSFTIPSAGEDRMAPPVIERRVLENAGGPCMLLTRAVVERAGVFDERFTPGYFEDSDLCLRARAAGFTLLYDPGAEVVHHGKVTSSALASQGVRIWEQFERNKRLFYERWVQQLEEDEGSRRAAEERQRISRLRIVLCYNRNAVTTASYCESALRRDHDVITAGRDQDVDLGPEASALDVVRAAGGDIDLVLVIEGDNYCPRSLDLVGCPTAWWAIDNHLHARDDQGWHFAFAKQFDQVFVAQRDYVPRFVARGIRARWLPLACDPEVHCQPSVERDLDIVFVGNVLPIHRRRRRLLDLLKAQFDVSEFCGVYREEMARLYARAKIVFNCSLAGDLNMRVFEGLASGAALATDASGNGLQTLLSDGDHLVLYEDDTLTATVASLLGEPPRREQIGARGRSLVAAHHTYRHRMQALVRTLEAASMRGGRRTDSSGGCDDTQSE